MTARKGCHFYPERFEANTNTAINRKLIRSI